MKKIILASTSPRRKELLSKVCSEYINIAPKFNEDSINSNEPKIYTMVASLQKAYSIYRENMNSIVIGSDTIVVIDDKILGKPKDRAEAKNMLFKLSNRVHYVISGISILSSTNRIVDYVVSQVKFKELSENLIEEYLNTEEYIDKAGSYAIQGEGKKLIQYYKGDLDNIVGLPTKYIKKHFSYYGEK